MALGKGRKMISDLLLGVRSLWGEGIAGGRQTVPGRRWIVSAPPMPEAEGERFEFLQAQGRVAPDGLNILAT